jgi:uncharacterized protein
MTSILVIVKVAERCNLDCPYCFMYHGADQSWRERPKFLSAKNRALLIDRCVEHLDAHPTAGVTIELHGGEPLLLGKARMREFLDEVRWRLPERTSLCLQTNGTLIDEEWIDLFEEHHVRWGVSSDGPPAIHDQYRRTHGGRPTAARVEAAIGRGMARRKAGGRSLSGVLAVANPAASGGDLIRYFHGLGVPFVDLLLPDANKIHAPFYAPEYTTEDLLGYYIDAFEAWAKIDDPEFEVRIFTEIMRGLFGERSDLDAFGAELSSIIVVESDGSYEFVDVMHICGADYIQTPLSLQNSSFSAYVDYARQRLPTACDTCQACPVFDACGGGYLPHRFDGKGFDNPSYYCDLLMPLIMHVYNYVRRVTPGSMWMPRRTPDPVESVLQP